MKSPANHSVTVPFVAALFLLVGCSDGMKSFEWDQIGGEAFLFPSPITALVESESDGSLLVGTSNGVIASFNTLDGLFTVLDEDGDGKTIYDIVANGAGVFYAVRDGGVRRKDGWGHGEKTEVRIGTKGTEYSPYRILVDTSSSRRLYFGTSNGAFSMPLDEPADTAVALKAAPHNGPLGYFSLCDTGSGLIFAGEDGAFITPEGAEGGYERIYGLPSDGRKRSVRALHDGYLLREDGILWDYGAKRQVAGFRHSPLNFVVRGDYVYAVSVSALEIVNIRDGGEAYTVRLPERHLNRARNQSCRQIALVRDEFLYVAPGGSALYRIPLAPYGGEGVVSLCSGGGRLYALTARNDLYSMRSETGRKAGRWHYQYSFGREDQVRLLGTGTDRGLFVSVNDTVRSYSGHVLSDDPVYRTDLFGEEKAVTCNFLVDSVLYQGRRDMVRAYRKGAETSGPESFPKKPGDCLECRDGADDYYPSKLAVARCGGKDVLVVGTLHSGIVIRDPEDAGALFECLMRASDYSKVLDIQAVGNTVYVLDDRRLSRFILEDGGKPSVPDTVSLSSLGGTGGYLNRVSALSSGECYVYSDYCDFSPGAYRLTFPEDGNPVVESTVLEGMTVSDAALSGDGDLLFATSKGVMRLDSGRSPAPITESALHGLLQKLYSRWPVSLILALIGIILVAMLGWLSIRCIRNSSIRKEKDKIMREVHGKVEGWQKEISRIKDKTELEDHLKAVEAEEARLGSIGKLISDYKRRELYPVYDGFIISGIRALDTSGTEQCDIAFREATAARETLFFPESRKEADDIIGGILTKRDSFVVSSLRDRKDAAKSSQECTDLLQEAKSVSGQLNTKDAREEVSEMIEELCNSFDCFLISEIAAQKSSDIGECEVAIENTDAAWGMMRRPDSRKEKKLKDSRRTFEDKLSNLMLQKKKEMAGERRESLKQKYGSYVVALFDTLVEESSLGELNANISKFLGEETVKLEEDNFNRLGKLDKIGQIISDARTVALGKTAEGKREAAELLSALEGIAARYGSVPDWYGSFKEKGVFVPWPEVKELENNEKELETYEMQKATNSNTDSDVKYYHLYQAIRTKMRERYKDSVMDFFDSYSVEDDKEDAQFKKVFKKRDEKTNHKWCFILFALSAKTEVGMYLLDMTYSYFQKERSTWTGSPDKDGEIHHLSHLMDKKEYAGLFGLIAKTAFRVIRREGDGEKRGRPKTRRRDDGADG